MSGRGKGRISGFGGGSGLSPRHVHSNVPHSVGGGAGSPSDKAGEVRGRLVLFADHHRVRSEGVRFGDRGVDVDGI
jgi:hypothetical protein